jgi:hypothetical protein
VRRLVAKMLRIKTDGDQEQGTVIIDVSYHKKFSHNCSSLYLQTLQLAEQKSGRKILRKKDVTTLYLNNRLVK